MCTIWEPDWVHTILKKIDGGGSIRISTVQKSVLVMGG